jgi:hypothetical protein
MTKHRDPDPFQPLDATALASVNGGRLIPSKQTDPAILQGIQVLAQAIVEVGQQLTVSKQASSQQMMQMMQQMMERRR